MCGPTLAWDWLVLDISYVVILIGGAMFLRARGSTLVTWVSFGTLSVFVGGFLFAATYVFSQADVASAASATESAAATAAMLSQC